MWRRPGWGRAIWNACTQNTPISCNSGTIATRASRSVRFRKWRGTNLYGRPIPTGKLPSTSCCSRGRADQRPNLPHVRFSLTRPRDWLRGKPMEGGASWRSPREAARLSRRLPPFARRSTSIEKSCWSWCRIRCCLRSGSRKSRRRLVNSPLTSSALGPDIRGGVTT